MLPSLIALKHMCRMTNTTGCATKVVMLFRGIPTNILVLYKERSENVQYPAICSGCAIDDMVKYQSKHQIRESRWDMCRWFRGDMSNT